MARSVKVVADTRIAPWVVKHFGEADIKSPRDFGDHSAFGVMENGRALAGVIFHRFRRLSHGNDISIIVVARSPRWAQRHVLRILYHYAFVTAGCARLTAVTREGNGRVAKTLDRLGFRKEGVLRRGWNGKTNGIVWSILADEAKWIMETGVE